jgi:menaquinone-dependent protoporphyrinogen oxidase
MRVLVAYASKRGGTEGIAHSIGDALTARGIEADVLAAGDAKSLVSYDAVIVGGALYAMRWHRGARRFVKRNAEVLHSRPVWFFSSGPLDASATEHDIVPVAQVRSLMDRVGARGHATFGGRLRADAKGFPASAMAKKYAGDWRDPGHIRSWANLIADTLAGHAPAVTQSATTQPPARAR